MSYTLLVHEVRGLKASSAQIYVKVKWKNPSSVQEERKSKEVNASTNVIFDPPFPLPLGPIDVNTKINFAVKESGTLMPKTLGSTEMSLSQMLDSQSGQITVTMAGCSLTCTVEAPSGTVRRPSTMMSPQAAASGTAHAALFDTEDPPDAVAKTGFSALAGNITGIFHKAKGGEAVPSDGAAADAADDEEDDGASRTSLAVFV